MALACNPSTWEAEAEGLCGFEMSVSHSEFEASQCYTVRSYLKGKE